MIYFVGHLANARNEMRLDSKTGKRKLTADAVEARSIAKKMHKQMEAGEVHLIQRRIAEDLYEYHAIPITQPKPPGPVALPFVTAAQLRAGR